MRSLISFMMKISRFDFMLAFKKLTSCLNVLFPAKEALAYMADYQALAEINVLAGKHFRDERLSMKGIPAKLRGITDAYLESKGIKVKIEPISILDADFQKQVDVPQPHQDQGGRGGTCYSSPP